MSVANEKAQAMPAESVRLQWKSTVFNTYTNRSGFYIKTVNKERVFGMFVPGSPAPQIFSMGRVSAVPGHGELRWPAVGTPL